jgi:phospholipid/cholesterol/gamma-HCH transport system substrate-binding protein
MTNGVNNKNNFLSGVFIVVGIVVTFASVIIFGGDRSFFARYFQLHVHFKQIQGLNIGSIVSLSGINVGNVSHIEFSKEERKIKVTLNIESQYQDMIREDSRASIKTQGALGDKYVYISPGSPDFTELKSNQFLIAENDDDDFFDLISKEAPKIANIGEVIKELQTLLITLNKNEQTFHLLKNLNEAAQQIQMMSREGQLLISETRKSSQEDIKSSFKHLNNILKKIDNGEGTLGALVNDPTIHQRISSILGKPPRESYLKPLIRATIKNRDK